VPVVIEKLATRGLWGGGFAQLVNAMQSSPSPDWNRNDRRMTLMPSLRSAQTPPHVASLLHTHACTCTSRAGESQTWDLRSAREQETLCH
jgi:hypothetical protein